MAITINFFGMKVIAIYLLYLHWSENSGREARWPHG